MYRVGEDIAILTPSVGIVAQTGLRMMPAFPTIMPYDFSQYSRKAGLSDGAFSHVIPLKPAPSMRELTSGLLPPVVHLVVASIDPL